MEENKEEIREEDPNLPTQTAKNNIEITAITEDYTRLFSSIIGSAA